MAVINGTTANDVLYGATTDDTINGGLGADTMYGGLGNDIFVVDNINDMVIENAGEGTDTVQTSVTYTLSANVENLTLTGTAAINGTGNTLDNVLTGNTAVNTLTGGLGNDTYVVQNTGDVVIESAGAGTDTVQSSVTYTLSANVENLALANSNAINGTGNALDNVLTGNVYDNVLDGGTGADYMAGLRGNDTYIVDNAGDVVTEYLGSVNYPHGTDTVLSSIDYTLTAYVENLTLTGTAALNGTGNELNNIITGNSAANTLTGGLGNDTYVVDNIGDVVIESLNEGTDTIQSSVAYTLGANVENLTLTGTAAINGTGNVLDNIITGNSANNTLTGGLGNDTYVVQNAGDVVVENAGGGTDAVQSSVTYTLSANVENLALANSNAINGTGNALDNVLTGNVYNNILDGGTGADYMAGGRGNDTYIVDNAGDVVTEYLGSVNYPHGTDTVLSSIDYTLTAYVENLTLTGTAALNGTGNELNNIITGNSAVNTLNGGAGTDTLSGGAGNDTYVVDSTTDIITEVASAGTDTVMSSITYSLVDTDGAGANGGNVENLTLTGTATINGTGNALNNVITGNSAINTLTGGAGNDIYVVQNTGDVVVESAGAGTDTVQSSVTYTLSANVENLTLTGSAIIDGTGNTLDNIIIGNSAVNTLTGSLGNDTYVVNNTDDVIVEYAGEGIDTVQSSVTYTLGINDVENLTLTGSAAINGTGNSLNNVLTGNAANNVLDGGAGADSMAGGLGDDTYVVDASDTLSEAANAGTDTVMADFTYTLVGVNNVENLTLTGSAAINGTGSDLNNVLTGNGADNTLASGAGVDTLSGGVGQDVLYGDVGNDTYLFKLGDGRDIITDYDTMAGNFDSLYLQDALATDVTLVRSGDNLVVNVGTGGDSVTIVNWLLANNTSYVVEQIKFSDNTTWDVPTIISMLNTAPFLVTNVPDATATVNQTLTYAIPPDAFADLDVGDSLSYAVTNADGTALPSWLTFDPNTLTLSGTPTSTAVAGIHDLLDLTVTATDHAGETAQDTFTLTVKPIGLTLDGTSGNDTLAGNDGDDIINGLAGADRMTGGWGDDTYVVDNTGDVVVENAGEGTDAVQSSISYTLGTNVENLTLTGSSSINATGNASDNLLIGNDGNNTLNGLSGADTMTGGLGNDTYVVQSSGDVVIENVGEGADTVQSAISYTLAGNVENLTLLGTSAIGGIGNGLDNAITGNTANNVLNGGEGSDVLTGYAGSDSFIFNTALGSTNVDTITDYTSGSDSMQLALAMFSGIGATGELSATAFVSGAGLTAATTATEHIVYDSTAGMLYYDVDGLGGAASVAFATLTAAPALTAADFSVM